MVDMRDQPTVVPLDLLKAESMENQWVVLLVYKWVASMEYQTAASSEWRMVGRLVVQLVNL